MFAIEAVNVPGRWYVCAHGLHVRWTDESARALLFDTREAATAWLTRRAHSGLGLRVRPLTFVH